MPRERSIVKRTGKKAMGRRLDKREWRQRAIDRGGAEGWVGVQIEGRQTYDMGRRNDDRHIDWKGAR